MAEIDRAHVDNPAYGARKIARQPGKDGHAGVTRWHVGVLMEKMNVRPCCPVLSLSKPSKYSKKFPYLLKGKTILFPNQVWSTDITYEQLGGRHTCLTAVIDWYSRHVVAWRLSDTMRAEEAVRCARQAFKDHGTPSVTSSDQGSVFGGELYTELLKDAHVAQSMDGRARWADNVLMERWFRTLKSEWLRTHEYSTPAGLEALISRFVDYCNGHHMHQSLGYDTPASWYCTGIGQKAA